MYKCVWARLFSNPAILGFLKSVLVPHDGWVPSSSAQSFCNNANVSLIFANKSAYWTSAVVKFDMEYNNPIQLAFYHEYDGRTYDFQFAEIDS